MNTLKTYKPNKHFKMITLEMIDKIAALEIPENNKFNFCKISLAQAIVNPLKVSYIKQDKIKSLSKHANIDLPILPPPEQRNKYPLFTTSITAQKAKNITAYISANIMTSTLVVCKENRANILRYTPI